MQEHLKQAKTASVVTLDSDEQAITLKFLMGGVSWDMQSREVVLPRGLAEQLVQMLAEEFDQEADPQAYYQLNSSFA